MLNHTLPVPVFRAITTVAAVIWATTTVLPPTTPPSTEPAYMPPVGVPVLPANAPVLPAVTPAGLPAITPVTKPAWVEASQPATTTPLLPTTISPAIPAPPITASTPNSTFPLVANGSLFAVSMLNNVCSQNKIYMHE